MKPYVAAGELVAIGVVQEQHPDRTRLYRQWRELDWPIFVDTLNVIEHVTVVPIPMALDESGVVAYPRFRPSQLDDFMKMKAATADLPAGYNRAPDPVVESLAETARKLGTGRAWRDLGVALFNSGREAALNGAVDAFTRAVGAEADSGEAGGGGQSQFALGATFRRRSETSFRQPGDAQAAVVHWGRALEANPNHYIWRRRLQQYGPRLDKPYNFYFWVEAARKDIGARGETPVKLTAEPMGSEIAAPQAKPSAARAETLPNPDPKGRISRDEKGLVIVEALVTPARVRPGHRVRVRLTFRLNERTHPLWNNEADNLLAWAGLPGGFEVLEANLQFANPETPETRELRQLEFEVAIPVTAPEGVVTLPAYALYYVCEDAGGVCYYLRNDFEVAFTVDGGAPTLK